MATKEVKTCSKCNARRFISICDGCQNWFCHSHAVAHHRELTEELNKIEKQTGRLFSSFLHNEEKFDHPLFALIEVWKYEKIEEIKRVANEAREKLIKTLANEKERTKKLFEKLERKLETIKNDNDFTETHLISLTKKLIEIKKQLETQLNVELVNDNERKPIQLIRIETEEKVSNVQIIVGAKSSQIVTKKCEEVAEFIVEPKPIEAGAQPVGPPEDQVESKENFVEIDSSKLLDPKKNKILLFHMATTPMSTKFSSNLKKFFGDQLKIFDDFDQMKVALATIDQATIIFYSNLEETLPLLDQCNDNVGLHSIYIRDKFPETNEKMTQILTKCGKIRGIVEHDLGLLSRWVMDLAGDYRMHADKWFELGEKDKAKDCFEYSIRYFRTLADFLKEERRAH